MNQLELVIQNSGLESTKAQLILDNFQDYFKMAAEWEIKAKQINVIDEHQVADMKLARTLRLFCREKRIAIEKMRKKLKEQSLREGKAIDGISNVLMALIIPIEDHLKNQECFVEIKNKEKEDALRIKMEKDALAYAAQEEEKRIEKERIAKRNEARRNNLYELGLKFQEESQSFVFKDIQVYLKNVDTMSDDEFGKLYNNILSKKTAIEEAEKQEQLRIKIENDRLKQKAEEADRKAKERESKLKQEADEKLNEERRQREKIELELLKRKEKEEEIIREANRKTEEMNSASDKKKLNKLSDDIKMIVFPEVKSKASKEKILKIKNVFAKIFDVLK